MPPHCIPPPKKKHTSKNPQIQKTLALYEAWVPASAICTESALLFVRCRSLLGHCSYICKCSSFYPVCEGMILSPVSTELHNMTVHVGRIPLYCPGYPELRSTHLCLPCAGSCPACNNSFKSTSALAFWIAHALHGVTQSMGNKPVRFSLPPSQWLIP